MPQSPEEALLAAIRASEANGSLPKGSAEAFAQQNGMPPPAPITPDYEGMVEDQTRDNRPNMNTPWGSQTWSQDEAGNWTSNVSLTPEQQALFGQQQDLQGGRMDLAQGMIPGLGAMLGQPMQDGSAARDQAISAAYGQAASRLDPQWQQREDQTRSQLINQGFAMGDEGFDKAMGDFGRQRNDAYTSAMNSAIGQGTAAGQSIFNMDLAGRNQGLNSFLGLSSGQQVGMPQMPGFSQAGSALPAAQMGFNAQLGEYNAGQAQAAANDPMQFIMSMAPYAGMAFSDERLKRNVRRLPIDAMPGVPFATWEWRGASLGPTFGVIAQDLAKVAPQYVHDVGGYLAVDYSFLR